MEKRLLIILFLFFNIMMMGQTTDRNWYENNWRDIEELDTRDLPESASKLVESILQRAIKEGNNQQVIKALIYKNKYKSKIDNEDREGIFTDLNNLIQNINSAINSRKTTSGQSIAASLVSERALLYSMLAELYATYYSNDRWEINNRTELRDVVPADMKEWTNNIFRDKIIENLDLSIKDIALLKDHTTKEYQDIIQLGTDGQKYYPTLYDFLMERRIRISKYIDAIGYKKYDLKSTGASPNQLAAPADDYIKLQLQPGVDRSMIVWTYYQEYMKDLLARNMTQTLVLTDISRLQYLASQSRTFSYKETLEAYLQLYDKYKDNEASTEIVNCIVDIYPFIGISDAESGKLINEWLNKGIAEYPDSYGAQVLRNKLKVIETPQLRISGNLLQHPEKKTELDVIYKNIQALDKTPEFKLYKWEAAQYKFIKEFNPALVSKNTYMTDTVTVDLGLLPVGEYVFTQLNTGELENTNNNFYQDNIFRFSVSRLISYSRNSKENEYEIFVVDRLTGKPIEGASVYVYPNEQNDASKNKGSIVLKTNAMGLALYKDKFYDKDKYWYSPGTYKVSLEQDSCLKAESLNTQYYKWRNSDIEKGEDTHISIFTDRNIYRPGQTIYFKAIALAENVGLLTNKAYSVELYDTSNRLVSQKEIITNEFGSISGEFVLAQALNLGAYRIKIDNSYAYFKVEEYKRPTFEITFDKLEKTYTFGDEIRLKGYAKNFSGINLQDADVKYTITREQFNFWFWRSGNKSQTDEGAIKTNNDGSFEIVFIPEASDEKSNNLFRGTDRQIYLFAITATVTDLNGETQSNTYTVTVGNVSMLINIDIPDKIEKSTDFKLAVNARNLDAKDIQTSGTYTIYRIDENDSIQSKVLDGSFTTGEQAGMKSKIKGLASGKYQLEVKAKDSDGNDVMEKKSFVLFSYADKKPPVKTPEWLVSKKTTFSSDGKPAEVIFGTSEKDTYILYQLANNKNVFEQRIIKLSEANQLFTISYKPEYGDAIYASFTFVKNGKIFMNNVLLEKEKEVVDTNLNLKMEVFRDKLRSGQAETWIVSVKDTTDKPMLAELLASMYDTSLDKLYPYMEWVFRRPFKATEYVYPINYNFPWYDRADRWFTLDYTVDRDTIRERTFDEINWFGLIPSFQHGLDGVYDLATPVPVAYSTVAKPEAAGGTMGRSSVDFKLSGSAGAVVLDESVSENKRLDALVSTSESAPLNDTAEQLQVRRNFAETAFFYPQLKTDDKGEVVLSFTVPESNTTWRFRALAHDKDARVGTLEHLVVTRKELMVTPNIPRFVRQGDKTSISTKISNLAEQAVSGNVKIEFFDPLTDQTIDLGIVNPNQDFSLEKGASSSVNWTFDVPANLELIGCRIVAGNDTFSDGEQHVLAVLSNRMLVTESMPLDVTEPGTSTFTFDKLYNKPASTENYRLTLEYASNPAWYAVQALPVMSNPSNENAVNWFASFYVNTLGASIVRQYPGVSAMIKAWQKQSGDKQTLISKLQKDDELKAVLLEETPWILDAKDETEQMQRLSLLFDLNNTNQITLSAVRKLDDLQNSDGGWEWYKGLGSNRSITQYILYGYARLQEVGQVSYPEDVKRMQMRALKYLDEKIAEDFKRLKENNKEWEKLTSISTNQLEFAYVRSFYRDIPIDQQAREAERFYTNVASKNWTKLNLYERSILSVILKRNGNKILADQIVKSIREYAVKDKSKGMYWPNNRSNVFMSLSAISTHTFLMDALVENGTITEEADMMKRWLIAQKRTQQWESTHASIDAITVLLSTGSNWFTPNTDPVTIKIGGETVSPQNKELGTGYTKEVWTKSQIKNEMGKVEITTSGTQPAYGALYWQYYEDLDKITAQKGDLNISKELFKEDVSSSGKGLISVSGNNPLTVGDKVIVRLTIRTDRDMDFVQLKDMRAPCLEPAETLSGARWANRLVYYQVTKDASTNFYFDHLPKGSYVLEYPVYVNRSGDYSNGITTIQCLYAPEFVSHTQGIKVIVKEK